MSPQATQRDPDCPECGGSLWITDGDGRPVRKCEQCVPPRSGGGAGLGIRGLLVERCREPGEFTVEDVLRFTRFAGSPAVGGVVSSLAREGILIRTGTRHSQRASRNGGTAALWLGRPHAGPEQLRVIE